MKGAWFMAAWLALMLLYLFRTPPGAFTHDFRGHLEYTATVALQHRWPAPYEGFETAQPPLFYWTAAHLFGQSRRHVLDLRLFAVACGLACLALMRRALERAGITARVQALTLAFIATTPAFVFLFSAYNNDALATLLAMALLSALASLHRRWRPAGVGLVGVLSATLFYAKETGLVLTAALGACLLLWAWWVPARRAHAAALIGGLVLGFCLYSPWLLLHNKPLSGRFFPTVTDRFPDRPDRLPQSAWKTLVTPPGWTRGEWKDPFAHLWELSGNKKSSYLAYLFTTSVWSEYVLSFFPPVLLWAILGCHGLLYLAGIFIGWRDLGARAGLLLIGFGIVLWSMVPLRAPYASLMDFRYLAWTWLPGGLATAVALQQGPRPWRWIAGTGLGLQALLLGAILLGGKWYSA